MEASPEVLRTIASVERLLQKSSEKIDEVQLEISNCGLALKQLLEDLLDD